MEVAETQSPSRFDREWLLTIRYGLRWMIASLYVFAFLAATSFMGSTESTMVAVMQFAAAVSLLKRNANRPDDVRAFPWPQWLLAASVPAYLAGRLGWVAHVDVDWIAVLFGVGLQTGALAMLWLRLERIAEYGIAPKTRTVARGLAWLTLIVGILTALPSILWRIILSTQIFYTIADGLRILWLVLLLVWVFASIVTLHLMLVPLSRRIRFPADTSDEHEFE